MQQYTIDLKDLKVPIQDIGPITIYGTLAQDLFVIAVTQGKKHGTYLEIGCGWPAGGGTNTFALEQSFGWSGISVDSGRDYPTSTSTRSISEEWTYHRPAATFLQLDALTVDYSKFPKYFDYLQIDIDPAIQSFDVLKKITEHIRFSVITFEHDNCMAFVGDKTTRERFIKEKNYLVREQSRNYLKSLGYLLLVSDISNQEDWWIDPKIIPSNVIAAYNKSGRNNLWSKILLKPLTQINLSTKKIQPIASSKKIHQLGQSRVISVDPALYGISRLVYVNIPKNASSWISQQFNQGVNHDAENINYYDIKDFTQCQFIVVLRDPLDRWISGMTQIIYTEPETDLDGVANNMNINTFDWKFVIKKIEYDNHTQKQIDFIRDIPHNQVVWLKFDNQLNDNFIDLMLSYGCDVEIKKSDRENVTHENSAKQSVMDKIVSKLDQHPKYRQKIINYYCEDYALINSVKFYKKQ